MKIHSAAERGNLEAVKAIVHDDPSCVHYRNEINETPLHTAVHQSRRKVIEFLIDAGADLNARDGNGSTPLHCAVQSSSKTIVETLLKAGADATIRDNLRLPPLYYAAATKNASLIRVFDKYGVIHDINSSVYLDGPEHVLSQLRLHPNLLNDIPNVENLLSDASYLQSLDLVKFLLDHGVNPNKPKGQLYPLQIAISIRNVEILKLLLEHGADAKIVDYTGRTLLNFAEDYGSPAEVIELLKQHGATE